MSITRGAGIALLSGLLALAASQGVQAAPPGGDAPPSDRAPVEQVPIDLVPVEIGLPTAAVAMGDSFISGEGAGDYQNVTDVGGVSQGFPGWTAPNSNPYFCHRSANASIQVASLAGIDARFNLACSGGQPYDMANASASREQGRGVVSQIQQLRDVATTHDIDLVLIGLGSNNSQFTFGTVAAECAGRFVGDGYTGWWEVWIHFINWVSGNEVSEQPCSSADMATPAQFAAAQQETSDAVRQILATLDEIDTDGQHRVVFQDYTNPLPTDLHPNFHEESGRNDGRDKFRALVDERYAAGCPVHRASIGPAYEFSAGLGQIVQGVFATMDAERPELDLVYLNVQHAFTGGHVCENADSPNNTLATPLRLMDDPNGTYVTDFGPFDKFDIKRLTETCNDHFQTCQESWHPNAAGHDVLGQCLSFAWQTPNPTLNCSRWPSGIVFTMS